ncbi:MAG: hypothetical protein MI864_04310 [Pseudomonadales bacterium]|nr:hypothetical protein [Pseudomonadales bacterium]
MWSFSTFDKKVKAVNQNVRIEKATGFQKQSSLTELYSLVKDSNPKPKEWILQSLNGIPKDKRKKYYDALEYLIYTYPNLTPSYPERQVPLFMSQFSHNYDMNRGDLIYGIHPGRCQSIYMQALHSNYCDEYNNHFGIGNGNAFRGIRDLSNSNKRSHVIDYTGKQRPRSNSTNQKMFQQVYHDTLMNSSFAPNTVFNLNESQLKKEKRDGRDLLELQWSKSIRKACKHGIKMIATQPAFTTGGAKIHFVLDGMGDLTKVAFKEPLNKSAPYVSITSSELTFVYRNWEKLNLESCVNFYVNAQRVPAPWNDHWSLQDGLGGKVSSGYGAWLRYQMKRRILKGKTR